MNDVEVEIDVLEAPNMSVRHSRQYGADVMQMIDLSDMMGKAFGNKPTKRRKLQSAGCMGQAGR